MDQIKPPLGVIQGGGGVTPWRSAKFGIELPMPPPSIQVDDEWRRIYIWLCDQLLSSKRDITAAAMQLTLLVECIRAWVKDRALCEKHGRYATSKEPKQRYRVHRAPLSACAYACPFRVSVR